MDSWEQIKNDYQKAWKCCGLQGSDVKVYICGSSGLKENPLQCVDYKDLPSLLCAAGLKNEKNNKWTCREEEPLWSTPGVYVLLCGQCHHVLYIGTSSNLGDRLYQHACETTSIGVAIALGLVTKEQADRLKGECNCVGCTGTLIEQKDLLEICKRIKVLATKVESGPENLLRGKLESKLHAKFPEENKWWRNGAHGQWCDRGEKFRILIETLEQARKGNCS